MRQTPAVLLALLLPALLAAQGPSAPSGRGYASRQSLDSLLQRMRLSAESPAYSQDLRDRASAEAERIEARLERGDFQVGDRILIVVEREEMLSDTFTVETGPAIVMPDIGSLSLSGVLRAELLERATAHIAQYVRDPVVRTRTLVRVLFEGAVGQPGFRTVPSDALLSDVITAVGLGTGARLDELVWERNGQRLLNSRELSQAIIEGRTLDELGIRAGDRLFVPEPGSGLSGLETPLRAFTILITLPATIFGLTRIF